MLNKFWRWIGRKVGNAQNEEPCIAKMPNIIDKEDDLSEKKIIFTMFFAEGGVILQRYHYDHQKDRSYRKLILIPEDKDVAEEVGNFVAMEILRSI